MDVFITIKRNNSLTIFNYTFYLQVTKYEASWIGSLMPLAALVGGLIGGSLLEALGRKTTILLTSIPFMCSGLLVTFAQDVNMIYAGRAITGFCIGIVSLSLPVRNNIEYVIYKVEMHNRNSLLNA